MKWKLNHNELLTYPNGYDQIYFASVQQAKDIGAAAEAYFDSKIARRNGR